MIPGAFEYIRPASLAEAIDRLAQIGDGAKLLSGGHSLLPMMKLRLAAPATLIDIAGLPELHGVLIGPTEVSIGAATTHAQIEHHDDLAATLPLLRRVASVIADPTVRNRGTVGGSLAHADPSADWPAAMLALDATIDVVGPAGARAIPAEAFFTGLFETALRPGEVLLRVRIPVQPQRRSAYRKFRHPASGYAVVAVAVVLAFEGPRCMGGRIAVTGFADHAFRATASEAALVGFTGQPGQTQALIDQAFSAVTALEDRFADAAYRTQLGRTLLRRALAEAVANHAD